jgi:hypothetical protein
MLSTEFLRITGLNPPTNFHNWLGHPSYMTQEEYAQYYADSNQRKAGPVIELLAEDLVKLVAAGGLCICVSSPEDVPNLRGCYKVFVDFPDRDIGWIFYIKKPYIDIPKAMSNLNEEAIKTLLKHEKTVDIKEILKNLTEKNSDEIDKMVEEYQQERQKYLAKKPTMGGFLRSGNFINLTTVFPQDVFFNTIQFTTLPEVTNLLLLCKSKGPAFPKVPASEEAVAADSSAKIGLNL